MSRLRIALAGASGRGAGFAHWMTKDQLADVVGICDPFVRKAEWIASHNELSQCRCFESAEDMLQNVECAAVEAYSPLTLPPRISRASL